MYSSLIFNFKYLFLFVLQYFQFQLWKVFIYSFPNLSFSFLNLSSFIFQSFNLSLFYFICSVFSFIQLPIYFFNIDSLFCSVWLWFSCFFAGLPQRPDVRHLSHDCCAFYLRTIYIHILRWRGPSQWIHEKWEVENDKATSMKIESMVVTIKKHEKDEEIKTWKKETLEKTDKFEKMEKLEKCKIRRMNKMKTRKSKMEIEII